MSENNKEPDDLDRKLDKLYEEMQAEDEEYDKVERIKEILDEVDKEDEPEEQTEESQIVEDFDAQMDEDEIRARKLRILKKLEQSANENLIDESIQIQARPLVEAEVRRVQTELEAQIKVEVDKVNREIKDYLAKAHREIDSQLHATLMRINSDLDMTKEGHVKKLIGLLQDMESDPENNQHFIISLFNTPDGIMMCLSNETKPKDEQLPPNTTDLSKKRKDKR